MENEKKIFDSAICFTFYGSWVETICKLETDADRESPAYMLFKFIAEYSMYDDEPNFDAYAPSVGVLKAFWPLFEKEIDNSVNRRKKGFAVEEPNEKQQKILRLHHQHPEVSYREIAKTLGISKSMVGRTIQKWQCSDAPCNGALDSKSNIGDNVFADNSVDIDTVDDSMWTGQWDKSLTEDEMPF